MKKVLVSVDPSDILESLNSAEAAEFIGMLIFLSPHTQSHIRALNSAFFEIIDEIDSEDEELATYMDRIRRDLIKMIGDHFQKTGYEDLADFCRRMKRC
jgi:hypothetical protein